MAEDCSRCRFAKNKQGRGIVLVCRESPLYHEKKPSEWCGKFERDPRLVRLHQPNSAPTVNIVTFGEGYNEYDGT